MEPRLPCIYEEKAQLNKLLALARKQGKGITAVKKRIEREVGNGTKEKYVNKKMVKVNFESEISKHKLMVQFDSVSKKYGRKEVFNNLSFEIRGSEKVWLYGPNGAGKSTLFKLIMGEEKPTNGEITLGINIKVGYFAQNQTQINSSKNLLSNFLEATGCDYEKGFGYLRKYMFEKEDLALPIKFLSPGQRERYAFAIFGYKDYDLLILDEPTNHLDIDTTEVIEESLRNFKGTLLLVSHDRFFVERVGMTKIVNMVDGKLTEN